MSELVQKTDTTINTLLFWIVFISAMSLFGITFIIKSPLVLISGWIFVIIEMYIVLVLRR